MNRIIKHRKLHGLSSCDPGFANIEGARHLSEMLDAHLLSNCPTDKLYLCGPLEAMAREWMREPLDKGWNLGREFAFKHRTAVYVSPEIRRIDGRGLSVTGSKEVHVKLVSHRESWFPGVPDMKVACDAWEALKCEWSSTGLPLLSSPAATGKALLWESLPCDKDGAPVEFPSLNDDLATLIRANSPQHRIEWHLGFDSDLAKEGRIDSLDKCIQYDGRWMYAAMCGLDRFPIGEPTRVRGFVKYQPGIYQVTMRIPENWKHVGLIPVNIAGRGWQYPNKGGLLIRTWAFEPELTLAVHGVKKFDLPAWEIVDVHDGYAFEKGRPLLNWSSKLIEMRENLQERSKWIKTTVENGGVPVATKQYEYAASAIRQILNHTIGAMHKSEYQRETLIPDSTFREWRRLHPELAGGDDVVKTDDGWIVPTFVQDDSPLSIFMPQWSSTIYSLARARVAEWALLCDPSTLVKFHGDAIYSTVEQSELDKFDAGRIGQPRRK